MMAKGLGRLVRMGCEDEWVKGSLNEPLIWTKTPAWISKGGMVGGRKGGEWRGRRTARERGIQWQREAN